LRQQQQQQIKTNNKIKTTPDPAATKIKKKRPPTKGENVTPWKVTVPYYTHCHIGATSNQSKLLVWDRIGL